MINRDQFAAYLVLNECADNTVRNYSAMFVRWCDWAIAHDYDPAAPDALAVRAWSKTINGTRSSLAHARATRGPRPAGVRVVPRGRARAVGSDGRRSGR